MDWYCDRCGVLVNEDDLPDDLECSCGGGFEECESCGFCGEWRIPDSMMCFPASGFTPICPDCFGKYEAKYRQEFLQQSMNDPDRPGDTWDDYFAELRGVPVFQVHTFWDFIRWEDEANEEFWRFCQERGK